LWHSIYGGNADAAAPNAREIPFNGQRAYEHLKQICEIGPRPSGSAGMKKQQELLVDHFQKLGGRVTLQEVPSVRHPQTGQLVPMANLIVEWHPDRKERILLCAHYDTRPYPDRDPDNPQGRFIGANDGASGVALLMELGREMPNLKCRYGVDFVLFDGEEFVFSEDDEYFLGSTHFARDYAAHPPKHRYRWGVLLDLIGDADLRVYYEKNSWSWPETRPLAKSIWDTAARLRVREFVAQTRHEVRDDHLPLRNIGKIPTCDIIDFDYPHWHTEDDLPDKCSADSLARVGWVIHEWLKSVR
jgi:hypothetical protein